MTQLLLAAAAVIGMVACGHPQKGGDGHGSGAGSATGGSDGGGSAAAADKSITRAECEEMIGHILDLRTEDQKKQLPKDKWPTDEDSAKAKAAILADEKAMSKCDTFGRASYACAMAAHDLAGLTTCPASE